MYKIASSTTELSEHVTRESAVKARPLNQHGLPVQHLPFVVIPAVNDSDLAAAVRVRQAAYGRHVPEFASQLECPEPLDRALGSLVLLARAKLDQQPVGSMRIQTNKYAPLAMEKSVTLPAWLKDRPLAEATRLGVSESGVGRLVKLALFKAYFQFCLANDIHWLVITARSPLDRMYEGLQFRDVFGEKEYIPMQHVGGIPHRVMAFDVRTAFERWKASQHPLLGYMCETCHPDIPESIIVDGGHQTAWEARRGENTGVRAIH